MIELNSLAENDPGTEPIYQDNYVQISQAFDSAVPGLYTIKPAQQKESVIEFSDTELALFAFMQRKIRSGLRTTFNVQLCGLYLEEHPGQRVTSYTIPFHVDRLSELYSVDVYQPYIEAYLKSYSFLSSQQQILAINVGLAELLNEPNVKRDVEAIKEGLVFSTDQENAPTEAVEKPPQMEAVLEVFSEDELPVAPEGKKYFVCIGGRKNYQCFLSDSRISRGEFILSHKDELDECLKPVYSDNLLIVRQDVKYAIPGFYIISPKKQYQSIDDMPQSTYERCMFMARHIKQGLLTLGTKTSHIYQDEKYNSPAFAHLWVLPIHDFFINEHGLRPTIFSRDIWTYLDLFPQYSTTKPQILEFNEEMRKFLRGINPI